MVECFEFLSSDAFALQLSSPHNKKINAITLHNLTLIFKGKLSSFHMKLSAPTDLLALDALLIAPVDVFIKNVFQHAAMLRLMLGTKP